MSGKEIVKRYLRDNGFDGLYCFSCYESCGCEIDDLMPCDSMTHECYPGIKEITKKSQWVIVPKKKRTKWATLHAIADRFGITR